MFLWGVNPPFSDSHVNGMLIYLILLFCLFLPYHLCSCVILFMYSSLSLYMILYDILMFPSFLFLSICPKRRLPRFLSHSAKEPAFLSMDWASEEESSLALRGSLPPVGPSRSGMDLDEKFERAPYLPYQSYLNIFKAFKVWGIA